MCVLMRDSISTIPIAIDRPRGSILATMRSPDGRRNAEEWSETGGGATVAWVDAHLMKEWSGGMAAGTGRGMRSTRRRGLKPGGRCDVPQYSSSIHVASNPSHETSREITSVESRGIGSRSTRNRDRLYLKFGPIDFCGALVSSRRVTPTRA